mgnify:CR=1 FL=1
MCSLYFCRALWFSGLPQTERGVTDAFPVPHTMEKSGFFCFVSNPASGVPSGRCYILTGHVQYPRGLAASFGPGSVFRLFLCPNPKPKEAPMLRFFLSSRYLRLRHRLLSLLITLAGRAGATLALGVLLMLPVVYLWEVR